MIEIVKEGTLEKHGINMFGEASIPPQFHLALAHSVALTEIIEEIVLPELCGPMGRIVK